MVAVIRAGQKACPQFFCRCGSTDVAKPIVRVTIGHPDKPGAKIPPCVIPIQLGGGQGMKAQPLIAVRDVERSSRWYQQLLGCQSGHGGNEYEQIVKDGEIILQLHAWDVHGHPNLCNISAAPHGFGVLLWFQLSAFDAAVEQARALGAAILEGPYVNTRANHRECWIRDPDDYVVVLAGDVGDVG
jgi:catechol 2,3-dioxygenase-like lactoylglutathione lyase family enzyme